MGKLTDVQIRAWIKADVRTEGKSDGNGLYFCYRKNFATPKWKFRYKLAGKSRSMWIGTYTDLSLAKAREVARGLSAKVALGHDVAAEKQDRKAEALAKIAAEKNAVTVAMLAEEYFSRQIVGRWKHPNIVRSRIDKDIRPHLGKLKVEEVKPRHVDDMLQAIVKRGAPTIANDVLRWVRRMFDYAIKRGMAEYNPASAFDLSDAGGKEDARDRALGRDELATLFKAMKTAKGFSVQNELTVKLLLLLCCRKMELCAAPWSEFDLDAGVWYLPGERTKTGTPIDIPLPPLALEWLGELKRMSCGSTWVLPARKMQNRMIPHIVESTLPVTLSKLRPYLDGMEAFTVHDLRRTARTQLAALGVDPVVAERCLNHKIRGVEGIYNRHQYFEERKGALLRWAGLLDALDKGEHYNVTPIGQGKRQA
ncbi:tyrosine-type recombinase/integrase [Zobellella maritima]|uniref:tyrosine-type recombinase/integrase n=1 Tax=Zobellella maritima TaxID=2059725 RepID=UPI000E2FFFD7|nr:site-specific integrase [Zobellella maritima]